MDKHTLMEFSSKTKNFPPKPELKEILKDIGQEEWFQKDGLKARTVNKNRKHFSYNPNISTIKFL